jgi:Protein of unknown function (DUF3551)
MSDHYAELASAKDMTMRRTALLGFVTLIAAFALDAAPAGARSGSRFYPWCAQYNLPGGPMSCSFATVEQCRVEISGVGGYCAVNPYSAYDPSGAVRGAPRRSARKYRR